MGLKNIFFLLYWGLNIICTSITVDSLHLRRLGVRNVCCSTNTYRRRTTILELQSPPLTELMQMANDNLKTSSLQQAENDPFATAKKFGLTPPPIALPDDSLKEMESQKAYLCSKVSCPQNLLTGPVCACNFNTGNVVSFKNKCDMQKHNCRFDTAFKPILDEICPWEFDTRRRERVYDYNGPKYFN